MHIRKVRRKLSNVVPYPATACQGHRTTHRARGTNTLHDGARYHRNHLTGHCVTGGVTNAVAVADGTALRLAKPFASVTSKRVYSPEHRSCRLVRVKIAPVNDQP